MVCNRCIIVVTEIFQKLGISPLVVELGMVILPHPISSQKRETVKSILESYGFELIDDKRKRIIEQIRIAVIEWVRYMDHTPKINLSDYVQDKCHHDYSFLSKLFSEIKLAFIIHFKNYIIC